MMTTGDSVQNKTCSYERSDDTWTAGCGQAGGGHSLRRKRNAPNLRVCVRRNWDAIVASIFHYRADSFLGIGERLLFVIAFGTLREEQERAR